MKTWLLVLALTHGADVASTCGALSRGATEGNPFMPRSGCGQIALASTAVVGGSSFIAWKLSKTHPKLAKTLVGLQIGAKSVAIGWNVTVGR